MKFTNYNDNWKFWQVTDSFSLNWAPPSDAGTVNIPHDAMIEIPQSPDAPSGSNTGFRKGGVFSYSKTFSPEAPDRVYMLKIEGAYMNAFVYVNGQLAAKRPFGYTVFYVPLNEYLNFNGENEIRIQVRTGAEPNSRWYAGTGLYRDVYLLEAPMSYIIPDSVKISVPSVEKNQASVNIAADLHSDSSCPVNGINVVIRDKDNKIVLNEDSALDPVSEDTLSFSRAFTVPDAELWDAEHPYLYSCTVSLTDRDGKVIDTHTDTFGIRTMSISVKDGLLINGREVKLRGSCIHHDSGILGVKTYDEIQLRQISILKKAGFNAVRCAHNPAAPALLRACDKVGMYVMDESFDIWTRHKSDYDYGMYFDEWWEADIESMVNNDYNHPSVIMYSIGNEIPEIGTDAGVRITRALTEKIRSMDPYRFVTASVNGIFSVGDGLGKIVADVAADLQKEGKFDGNVNNFMAFMNQHMPKMILHPIIDEVISRPFEYTDIAGYNYMSGRCSIDARLHPDRIIVGSENGISSAVNDWEEVKTHKNVIGDFCWTGWDYLGEAGIGYPKYGNPDGSFGCAFPMQTSSTGDIDITGFRMPMSYFREIIWGIRKDPYIAVQDPAHYKEPMIQNPWLLSAAVSSWSWSGSEGKPVVIEVYSDADEIELFKNSVSLGRKPAGTSCGFISYFETVYEPGILEAVAYTDGKESGRFTIESPCGDAKISIHEDLSAYAPESDIAVLIAEFTDDKGTRITDADTDITVTVPEGVSILGYGSGNPLPEHNYTETVARSYRGRVQLIVKTSKKAAGKPIRFTCSSSYADYII